jgi:hypothetical protein
MPTFSIPRPKFTQIEIFGMKINHLAALLWESGVNERI